MSDNDSSPFAVLLPEGNAGNSALPVVVLMGWVEAQRDGALLKYAELLAQAGYPSCRSVQPTSVAFSPFERPRRDWALAMLRHLEQRGLWPHRRLVLYAFSNGGAFVVEQMLMLAESDRRYAHLPGTVAGFVFDSAPAYMHPGMLQKVLAAGEPPSLRRWLKTSYFSVATAVQPLLSRSRQPRAAKFWHNMTRLHWGRPLLFLYSADDPLCDGSKVDELVAAKRQLGQDARARRWQQSGHVSHLRHHSREYTAILLHFLASIEQAERAAGGSAGSSTGAAAAVLGVQSRL